VNSVAHHGGMKALFLFNVDYVAWPLAIHQALERRIPGLKAAGIVVLDHTTHDLIAREAGAKIAPLFDLSALEKEWINHLDLGHSLDHYKKLLGDEAFSRIALADRELSNSLISGAITPKTPLALAVQDPVKLRAYQAGLLDLLFGLFCRENFDFVFSFPPQDAPSVAAGLVARHFGIPFFQARPIGFLEKTSLCDDVEGMMPLFRRALDDGVQAPDPQKASLIQARDVLEEFRNRPTPPTYMTVANATAFERPLLTTLAALAYRTLTQRPPGTLRDPYPFSRLIWELRRWLCANVDARSAFFRPASSLDGAPFVYYPLHFEPEASTMVAAPHATNQIAIVENLSKSTPLGWTIAVKEHLPMLGRRPSGYYKRLTAIPKVKLITPFANSFELIKTARLTVTVTGTAGLEAVLLKRPALFLGPSPVHVMKKGFVICRDPAKLAEAIDLTFAAAPVDDETMLQFIAAMLSDSVDLPADLLWGGVDQVTPERVAARADVSERIADLIINALAIKPNSTREPRSA
jgi:Capsule polysaccharide biosynthesis protein